MILCMHVCMYSLILGLIDYSRFIILMANEQTVNCSGLWDPKGTQHKSLLFPEVTDFI